MYPHVVQFETRSGQFKPEAQLIREREQAQTGKTASGSSLLTGIGAALAERGPRNPLRHPRGSTSRKATDASPERTSADHDRQ